MRSSLLVVTFGLLGCVPLPHAKLVVVGQGTREVLTGPVVCGPIGFRKVPLQARWGEYVRVTVAAPSVITGTVLVHANGIAHEPRSWSTESGALVIDARFPNEDPDARFALERERPIDLTLTGLSAPNGGTCEGAVFTVEQGALVPSVDERAWIAELERRGGPELAARRERVRVEAEARRQAHYAAWEARQQVEVSAAIVAQAEVIRQAHYAQWEARQTAEERGNTVVAVATGEAASRVGERGNTVVAVAPGAAASLAPAGERVGERGNTVVAVATGGSVATTSTGSAGFEASVSSTASAASEFAAFPTAPLQPAATVTTIGAAGEWSQPSDSLLRAPAQVSAPPPGAVPLEAGAQVQAGWAQPYQSRLEAVAVSTESRVATSAPYEARLEPVAVSTETRVAAPPPTSCQRCSAPAQVVVDGAALFNFMLQVGAAAAQGPAPVHGAQPVSR